MISYGSIPRKRDRAKTYLYLKEWASRFFKFKNAAKNNNVIRVMLLSSLDNSYVEGSAQNLHVCGQTIRNHLKHQDPQRLLQINREIVEEMKKKGALSKPLVLAVDWHDEMYYGDPKAEGVVGAARKNGSNCAYRFATASVLFNGQRLTLAVTSMLDRCIFWHVKLLLECVFELGVTVKLVLFDRGYFSTDLIRYLDDLGISYIMHIPWRGKPLKPGEDRRYTTTTHKRIGIEQVTFRLVTLRQKGKLLVFATNTSFRRRKLHKLFRRRWGIETSYRVIGMFLAKTTSKRYRLRVLYFFLAVVLYNLWVLRNFRCRRRVSVHALQFHVRLCLVLSWLPDLESGG